MIELKNVNFRRFGAYFIDIIIVAVITSLFSLIPFLNPNRDAYEKKFDEVLNLYEKVLNEDITSSEYESEYIKLYYDLNVMHVNYAIINLVVLVGYFVIFQGQNKGQTLGKKLMKIQVLNLDEKPAGFKNLLVRSIILYNMIISIFQVVSLQFLTVDNYYSFYSNLDLVGYILLYLNVFLLFIRMDKRGLHDLLGRTKVVNIEESLEENVKKSTKSKK